jgi:hypothetical protein
MLPAKIRSLSDGVDLLQERFGFLDQFRGVAAGLLEPPGRDGLGKPSSALSRTYADAGHCTEARTFGQCAACDLLGTRIFGVFWFGELFREVVKLGL